MEATRRALRRRPLSDCSNVAVKSSSLQSAAGAFPVKKSVEASPVAAVKVLSRKRNLKSPGEGKYSVISGKENVNEKRGGKEKEKEEERVDVESSLLSTPPVRKMNWQIGSSSVDPMTIYTRRSASKKNYGSSSCPPAENKRDESFDGDDQSTSKLRTEPSKKRRSLPEDLISQDFIERQRAYFQEIDKFELPEEEVSESE
ncbi:unnamed protein product [Rhodiola kirilowii]